MSVEISRRDFLRAASYGALYTGLAVGATTLVGKISEDKMMQQAQDIIEKAKAREQEGKLLDVKDYSIYIVAAASQTTSSENIDPKLLAAGYFTGVTAGSYFLEPDPDSKERAIGAGAMVAGRAIDMASTIYFSQFMVDPRFKEYGLDAYFKEQSPALAENPSPEDVIKGSALSTAFLAALSAIDPKIGTGYLGVSPILALNNYQTAQTIQESLRLGDGVKMVIGDGGVKEDVIDYLRFEVESVLDPRS